MSRKGSFAVLLLIAAVLAMTVPAALASTTPKALRFKVVKRTASYDFVRRGAVRVTVRRGSSVVRVHGVPRYRVVKRTASYDFVRRGAVRVTVRRGSSVVRVHGVPRYRVVKRTRAYYLLRRLTSSLPTPTPTATVIPSPTPSPTPSGVPAGVFNVKDYGAKADGVTDDAAAVQRAVNACAAAGGGTVSMPAGHYYFKAVQVPTGSDMQIAVQVKSGVHVVGAGKTQTFVVLDHTLASPFAAYAQTDIGVSDMDLASPADWTPTYPASVTPYGRSNSIKVKNCRNVLIENVVAHRMYGGIQLYNSHDSVVRDCVAYDCATGFDFGLDDTDTAMTNDNCGYVRCEAYGNVQGFRLHGYSHASGAVHYGRANNAYLTDCSAHDNDNDFRVLFASNVTMLRCTATNAAGAAYRICLANVDTAHLTSCTAAYLVTSANQNPWWVAQDSRDCVNIVQN